VNVFSLRGQENLAGIVLRPKREARKKMLALKGWGVGGLYLPHQSSRRPLSQSHVCQVAGRKATTGHLHGPFHGEGKRRA